ncbi:MAG: YXWGXW repeat-containing protein [Xanthomonadaceae bacterium]|nr:YXWGXW repeat-containing protein [Xanthomonadaceae bacterium]
MKYTMPLKLALLAGLGLTCAAATTYAPPASARVVVDVGVRVGPPPPRFERAPPPRRGYVWAPGYWRWDGHRHVWAGGYWVRARPGFRYHPAYWIRRGDEWRFHRGYWVH